MSAISSDSLTLDVSQPDGPLVAHVVIVAFHAKLGNRIEFAYPRLRGDVLLRATDLRDSLDISADPLSPFHSPRPYNTGLTPTHPAVASPETDPTPSPSAGGLRGDWGQLPEEWKFLPFMAMPEGCHSETHDIVFFTLQPNVHCVSCFRQVDAAGSSTHSASGGRNFESSVAARGRVQKSVVLLCRRPLYGVLADRLAPAVRAYFEQGDFARTDVLASLFHSLNSSLTRPSLRNAATLFHGLDLRSLIRLIGIHALSVLKLIMLEKRVVFYSQPVALASNAVIAFASIFPGALDSVAPTMTPLDGTPEMKDFGLPLALFGSRDRVVLQPYAPLPHITELLQPNVLGESVGCLISTSLNVGMLLSSAAAAASARERSLSPSKPTVYSSPARKNQLPIRSQSVAAIEFSTPQARKAPPKWKEPEATPGGKQLAQSAPRPAAVSRSLPQISSSQSTIKSKETPPTRRTSSKTGRMSSVDALVNLSTGKVSVSSALEPFVRLTKGERRFMRDLVAAAAAPSSASVSSSGATGSFVGSDDYIRDRLRKYLLGFLASAATVNSVSGGPPAARGPNTRWKRHEVLRMDLTALSPYGEKFGREWLMTRNASIWSRKFSQSVADLRPPPAPEYLPESALEEGVAALPAALQMPVDDLVTGLRQNVAELGRLSEKAVEGFASFWRRMEVEVSKVESAIGAAGARPNGLPSVPLQKSQPSIDSVQPLRMSKSDSVAGRAKAKSKPPRPDIAN